MTISHSGMWTIGLWALTWASVYAQDGSGPQPAHAWQVYPLTAFPEPGRAGSIRIGQDADGLIIHGDVSAPMGSAKRMDTTIGIWLADGTPAELPPIGWGNQFGPVVPTSIDDPDPPMAQHVQGPHVDPTVWKPWYRQQIPYRLKVAQLFARHWTITPLSCSEVGATPAFASLTVMERNHLACLSVQDMPTAAFNAADLTGAFTVDIHIPWAALPPLRSLTIQDLRCAVDIADGANGMNVGHAVIAPGPFFYPSFDASALIPIRLREPRIYRLTADALALSDAITPDDVHIPYICPARDPVLDRVVVLENTEAGYQYDPDPDARSPIAEEQVVWSKALGASGTLHGPNLVWQQGGTTIRSEFTIDDPGFAWRTEANGDVLVKDGPRQWFSKYGSGLCGLCPRIGIDIYRLSMADHRIIRLLSYEDVVDVDADIAVRSDWRQVTGYSYAWNSDVNAQVWRCTDYLYFDEDSGFRRVDHQLSDEPPNPRALTINHDP